MAMQMLHGYAMLLLAGILLMFALKICATRFILLLRRTRWILISLLFIYAYTNAGAALWPQLGIYSPAVDGIVDGLLQIVRLLAVLAGLSILLTSLSQTQLIAGLYTLFYPLRFIGLSRERIALRLALTLHYAENVMLNKNINWKDNIEQMLQPAEVKAGIIELQVVRFAKRDWLFAAISSLVLFGIML